MINKEYRYLGFLDIPYYACSDGHIYDREYHMVNEFGRKGTDSRYKAVSIFGKIYNVHHLIGWAFPEIVGDYESGLQIDHLNTNPSDNRPQNLKWSTAKENIHNPITWARMHSKERRQRQSELQKARWDDPNSVYRTDEYKQKQSDSIKNAWANPELRQRQSESKKKFWEKTERRQNASESSKRAWQNPDSKLRSAERIQKISESKKKRIVQLTLNGEFIREWDSATDAYDELGVNSSSISQCCKGKYNSAGGFKWKFKIIDNTNNNG